MDCLSGVVVTVSDELIYSITQVVNLFLVGNYPQMPWVLSRDGWISRIVLFNDWPILGCYLDGLQFGVGVAVLHPLIRKIRDSFGLSFHALYLDDGTIVGDTVVVGNVLDLIMEDGPRLYFTMRTCLPCFFESAQRSFDVALRISLERIVTLSFRFGDQIYGFLLFSFSSLGELEADAVTLLKRILKFSITQDIGARAAIHIFNRISFAIAKAVGAQIDIGARTVVQIFNRIKFVIAKGVKYEAKCANIGYSFLPFSFSSLEELEEDEVTSLKRIRKFSIAQYIRACVIVHIFNRIGFAIAKGVRAQIVSRLPTKFF
ncbi:hypothetical protein Tco_1209397 [Tanacetum coccineum]